MQLAICEDEALLRGEIEALVTRYAGEQGYNINISQYDSGEALLASALTHEVIFLDISMKGLDGIETAKRLRQLAYKGIIVFLTSHEERVFEAFEVNAFRYLVKPVRYETMYDILECVYKEIQRSEKAYITIDNNHTTIKIPYNEIAYIESEKKNLHIHTLNKSYSIRAKISDFEKEMQARDFYRIHKSFLVNMAYVREIEGEVIYLENSKTLYSSRLRVKSFKEAFRTYLIRGQKIWQP